MGAVEPNGHYRIVTPRGVAADFYRAAKCEEVGCAAQAHGWRTVLDETTELGQRQAWHIRNAAGRKYAEQRTGALTTFTFPPDQQCFAAHQVRTGRPELYVVQDSRGGLRAHTRPLDWVDDLQTNGALVAEMIERG